MGKLQTQKFWVMKPIKYKNPDSDLYLQRITPEDGLALTFPHLPDADIMLLQKKRIIAPVKAADLKELKDAIKAKEAEQAAEEKATAASWEAQKKSAYAKTLANVKESE